MNPLARLERAKISVYAEVTVNDRLIVEDNGVHTLKLAGIRVTIAQVCHRDGFVREGSVTDSETGY